MRKVFLLLLVVFVASLFAGKEGQIGVGRATAEESLASMADLYTIGKLWNVSAESGTLVTVATKWPGMKLVGFVNRRADSLARIKVILAQGDTLDGFPISGASFAPIKMAPIIKIFITGTSDSLFPCFQKR